MMKYFKPDLKSSGFSSILLILIVVIVLAGVGFLFLKNSNKPLTQKPLNKTAQALPELKTYTHTEAGFSLKYPTSVLLDAETEGATQPILSVSAQKLSDIPEDLPSFMGRSDALKQKADLSKGGGTTVKIGSLNGQVDTHLSQFEICSVLLTRSLTFYPGDYRVIISLAGPKEAIIKSMPEFFTTNPTNCGTKQVWNQDKVSSFESTLAQKKGQGVGQDWYDTFDAIVKTITLTTSGNTVSVPSNTTPTPSSTLPPDWSAYKNTKYGFEISYPKTFKTLIDKDSLSGYPNGVALLYTGGQAYDIVIELWNTKAEYESNYSSRVSDLTVVKSGDKFITLLDNTKSPENKKIIDSFKLLP